MAGNLGRFGRRTSRKESADRFIELMDKVSLGVRPATLEAWSEIELTMHQFRAIALLRQGPQRVSDIAEVLGIRLSAATSFVDRLEAKGLVQRVHDLKDRRVVRCQLTPLGIKEADSLWRISGEWLEQLTNILTTEELETVVHALEVLSSAIERQPSRPPSLLSEADPKDRGVRQVKTGNPLVRSLDSS